MFVVKRNLDPAHAQLVNIVAECGPGQKALADPLTAGLIVERLEVDASISLIALDIDVPPVWKGSPDRQSNAIN